MATQDQSAVFYSENWPLQSPPAAEAQQESSERYVEQPVGNGTKNTEAEEDLKLEQLRKDSPAIPTHAFTCQQPTHSFIKESFDPETFPLIPNSPKADYGV
jgi:hypothetical protein